MRQSMAADYESLKLIKKMKETNCVVLTIIFDFMYKNCLLRNVHVDNKKKKNLMHNESIVHTLPLLWHCELGKEMDHIKRGMYTISIADTHNFL